MIRSLLIVDPNTHFATGLATSVRSLGAGVTIQATYDEAQREITQRVPSLLVAHAHLGVMRGSALAHVATRANRLLRSIIYAPPLELLREREERRSRIFFERQEFLPHSLKRFMIAELPAEDRRDIAATDRRGLFRGGRRASDIEALHGEPKAPHVAAPAKHVGV